MLWRERDTEREREGERKGAWLKEACRCIALYTRARVTRRIFLPLSSIFAFFFFFRPRLNDEDDASMVNRDVVGGKMEGREHKGWVNASMTKWRLAGLIGGREKLPRPAGRESRYVARFNASDGGFDAGEVERDRNTDGWNLTADKFASYRNEIFIFVSRVVKYFGFILWLG